MPDRDLLRLLKKEVVLAENASGLFRTTPYLVFTAIWLGAALVPTFSTALALTATADLIALVALLASVMLLIAALVIDLGLARDIRRQAQNAAEHAFPEGSTRRDRRIADKIFKEAGLASYIDARLGDAHEIVPGLPGPQPPPSLGTLPFICYMRDRSSSAG